MTTKRLFLLPCFTAAALGAALLSPALAPKVAMAGGADDKAAAQSLFDEGRKLMDQHNYALACPKLESSQRLDPGAGTLMNLAACYEKNGQSASAWVTYTDAATASQDRHPDWAAKARERAGALAPGLSRLTVEVPNAPSGVEVKRDGKVLESGSYGTAIPTDPGHHVIDATAPGHAPFHREIDIAGGGAKTSVTVTLEAQAVGPGPGPGPGEGHPGGETPGGGSSGSGMRIAGIATLGVGVVGIALGTVFGIVAIGDKNTAAPNCLPDFSKCTTAGKAAVDDAMTMGTISTIGFIAGGVLAAAGLTIFLLAPSHPKKEAALGGGPSIEVRVGSAGGPLGLTMGGAF